MKPHSSTISEPGSDPSRLLTFLLAGSRYALEVAAVERVVPMVRVTPLPEVPAIVIGVVNFQGKVLPVVDTRRRLGLPDREVQLSDNLLIACSGGRSLALVVDRVDDVVELPAQQVQVTKEIVGSADYVKGVAKLADGLILIHDLEKFLSLEEEAALERALEQERKTGGDRDLDL